MTDKPVTTKKPANSNKEIPVISYLLRELRADKIRRKEADYKRAKK